jgi:hypothetical protein
MEAPRLKIQSKKLHSGNYQINFSTGDYSPGFYGYLLAEPRTSLKDVIEKISRHLEAANNEDRYFQRNLYSLGKRKISSGKILIFKK